MLAYAIKSAIFLSIMYIPYMLMLRKESFFHFNRILLISIMLLSLILPLCDFHALSIENNPIQDGMTNIILPAPTIRATEGMPVSDSINWVNIMLYIYFIGMIMIALWKVVQICLLYRTIHSCVLWKDKQNGITIYCHAQDIAPFSWLNTIVISENDYQNNAREILCHDIGHIRHYHSLDILLMNIIETIQWWNPLSWILASSLRDVHEFEADNEVRRSGVNIQEYQMLLIRKAVGSSSYAFANGFNHSLLKKRITMMLKSKSNPWMRTKALYIIPVATIAISVFATPELNNRADTIAEKVQTIIEDKGINTSADIHNSEAGPTPIIEAKNDIASEEGNHEEIVPVKETKEAGDSVIDNINKKLEKQGSDYRISLTSPDCDTRPEFPGGDEARSEYYNNNKNLLCLGDPSNEATVSIYVDVVVEKDGTISNAKISRFHTNHEISEVRKHELKDAAIKFYSNMPKHVPAKKNGQPVRYEFTTGGDFKI